jgi:hypothetical protein
MPQGVSYEGVFGEGASPARPVAHARMMFSGGGSAGSGPMAASASPSMIAPPADESADEDRSTPANGDAPRLTAEQQRQWNVDRKLDEVLRGLADKLDADGNYTDESLTVSQGKIEVAVYLTDFSAEAMTKLTELGFAMALRPATNTVVGAIDVARLADLAQIEQVRRIGLPELPD